MDSDIEAYSDDDPDLRWKEHRDRLRHTDQTHSESQCKDGTVVSTDEDGIEEYSE